VGQIRQRVFPATASRWDRHRCSSGRYPSLSPAWYCRPSSITRRPAQGTGRPSRVVPPPRIPATGSAEARGHALSTQAPGRHAHPASRFGPSGGARSTRVGFHLCTLCTPSSSEWRNCAKCFDYTNPRLVDVNTGQPRLSTRPRCLDVDRYFRATAHRTDTPGPALGIVCRAHRVSAPPSRLLAMRGRTTC